MRRRRDPPDRTAQLRNERPPSSGFSFGVPHWRRVPPAMSSVGRYCCKMHTGGFELHTTPQFNLGDKDRIIRNWRRRSTLWNALPPETSPAPVGGLSFLIRAAATGAGRLASSGSVLNLRLSAALINSV